MATSSMRSLKLQEFNAHESNVNCLALGQISGRVLVTGGDDKKVNLWAIGTPNYVLSLNAHTNPVECVKFGHTEEFVCSGSQAGELNIWDLEANKKTRTFVGHKDAIKCMDFHPYGDFLTSGSLDTSIKLWDLRRRGCISNYKGHSLTVNSVRFSPDGLWLASGGDDGLVKLWDVRVGRQLQEFSDHTAPVLAVEFHPHEFLLASGSMDKTVNFWDLENFQLVSTTEKDTGPIRCLHFSPEGECLYAGVEDYLKVYAWEPARTLDSVSTNWGKIQDIVKTPNQLIGASFHKSKVTLQTVDLKLVSTNCEANKVSMNFVHGQTARKSFSKEKLTPPKLSLKHLEETDRSGNDTEEEPAEPSAIFQPHRTLNRTPPPVLEPLPPSPYETDTSLPQRLNSPTSESEPLSLSSLDSNPRIQASIRSSSPRLIHKEVPTPPPVEPRTRRGSLKTPRAPPIPPPPEPVIEDPRGSPRRRNLTKFNALKDHAPETKTDFPLKMNNIRHSPSEPSLNRPTTRIRKNSLTPHSNGPVEMPHEELTPRMRDKIPRPIVPPKPNITPAMTPAMSPNYFTPTSSLSTSKVDTTIEDEFIPMSADKPTGLDMDDFLPKNSARTFPFQQTCSNMSEAEGLSALVRGHNSMTAVLSNRARCLQIVFSLWHNKDAKAAIESAVAMDDPAVIVDLLGVLVLRPTIWSLDICGSVLPSISDLLQSKYELYMTTGCTALSLILRNFAHIIKTNVQAPIQTVGVDISREERYNKCIKCYKSLLSIRAFLLKRQTMQGKLGHSFRELLILMEGLDN